MICAPAARRLPQARWVGGGEPKGRAPRAPAELAAARCATSRLLLLLAHTLARRPQPQPAAGTRTWVPPRPLSYWLAVLSPSRGGGAVSQAAAAAASTAAPFASTGRFGGGGGGGGGGGDMPSGRRAVAASSAGRARPLALVDAAAVAAAPIRLRERLRR